MSALTTESGTIEGDGHTVTYTAGDIDGCGPTEGHNDSIYVVIADPGGNQDWSFSRLAIWDASATIDTCPEVTCEEEDTAGRRPPFEEMDLGRACGCGCAGGDGAAVIGVGLGLLGLTVRRRR